MKKIIATVLLFSTLIFSVSVLTSCLNNSPKAGTVTRMTVDINPSVEFMVDDRNKVVSVTALNDDGSILIVGEEFVGKTPDEAVELVVKLATDTGYLVKGNVTEEENTVKISVSGDSAYAKKLMADVTEKAKSVIEELDINGKIEKVEALSLEALRKLALSTSIYTEEEINTMSEEELNKVISVGRIETALLLTEQMRDAYYSAKEHKISFAESEETAKIIEAMGGLYAITHKAYKTALDLYATAISELDNFRYNMLISPESDYQKSLVSLREAKVELLKQKNYTASLEINGTEYASAMITLRASEENFNRALTAYEELGNQLNSSLEGLVATLKQSETSLRELESALFDTNIKEKLKEKATEIEANLNEAKDSFFAEFENAHKDDISSIKDSLIAKKQQLINEIDAGKE